MLTRFATYTCKCFMNYSVFFSGSINSHLNYPLNLVKTNEQNFKYCLKFSRRKYLHINLNQKDFYALKYT